MKITKWFAAAVLVAALAAQTSFAAPTPAPKPAPKTAAPAAAGTFPDDAPANKPLAGTITIPTDAASVAAGAPLFKKNCASCHGLEGKGDGPAGQMLDPKPRNYHTDKLKYGGGTDAALVTTVWLGAKHWQGAPPTSGMAGFKGKLQKPQVLQILAFVKATFIGKK